LIAKKKWQDDLLKINANIQRYFLQEFRKCWEVMDLFGKKRGEMEYYYDIYFADLKDLSGYRVCKALRHLRQNQSKFPNVSDIRAIAQDLDYDLTKEEKEFKIMFFRARNKFLDSEFFLTDYQEKNLADYEKKFGKINVSITWEKSYEEKFEVANESK
jgi:hypothetical protein